LLILNSIGTNFALSAFRNKRKNTRERLKTSKGRVKKEAWFQGTKPRMNLLNIWEKILFLFVVQRSPLKLQPRRYPFPSLSTFYSLSPSSTS